MEKRQRGAALRNMSGLNKMNEAFRRVGGAFAKLSLCLCAMVVVTACQSSRGGPIPYATQELAAPDRPAPAAISEDYRITTGDKLQVTVFRVEDLSAEYRVDLAGNLAMPLIGNVQVMGRTTGEVRDEIARRLGDRYLRDPDVTVSVIESTNNRVTVEGGVRSPGLFPLTGQTTLLQAVALAQGIDPQHGNPRRIAIFRRVGGQRMAAAFDLESIRNGAMVDPEIYPGDIVVVQSNSRRGLFQDVLSALPLIALFRPF
jgi:polysaccharide export outer membrane protein